MTLKDVIDVTGILVSIIGIYIDITSRPNIVVNGDITITIGKDEMLKGKEID